MDEQEHRLSHLDKIAFKLKEWVLNFVMYLDNKFDNVSSLTKIIAIILNIAMICAPSVLVILGNSDMIETPLSIVVFIIWIPLIVFSFIGWSYRVLSVYLMSIYGLICNSIAVLVGVPTVFKGEAKQTENVLMFCLKAIGSFLTLIGIPFISFAIPAAFTFIKKQKDWN